MKIKLSLLLGLLILTTSCKQNEVVEQEELIISLIIENEFILDKQTADILIHDSDGILIDEVRGIMNRMSYNFPIQDETDPVFFTLVLDYGSPSNYYRIESFLIEETTTITLGKYMNRNVGEDKFVIDYEGNKVRRINSSSSSLIGGSMSASLRPRFFPNNELFTYSIDGQESRKVANIPMAEPNKTYYFNSLDKWDVVDSIEFQVNEPEYIYSYLYGRRSNVDQYYISLSDVDEPTDQIVKHYLPVDGIDDFLLWTWVDQVQLGIGFGSYEFYSKFDSDMSFSKPAIDLKLNEVSVENLEISSSDGHFFKTSLLNSIGSVYRINWEIHGEIDQSRKLNIPDIEDYMLEVEPNYDPSNLENRSTTIYKTNQSWSYNEFILFSIENIGLFNIPSSIDYTWENHF